MSQYKKNTRIELPPLITSKNDFSVIEYHITSPNYITSKKVTDVTLLLDSIDTSVEIDSKLILIENADPGFDWIFSKNPAGLITKYGGIASHMAIRCAELGLPAAIGCGELLFDKLRISTKVTLDCKNNDILILDYKQKNSFSEERKILKSLGYIK
jgi:phosphoenolpyruvate-protein kinase (PTS system EI component)